MSDDLTSAAAHPEGKKFRSRPQIAQYFGDTLDLTKFDFRTGRIDPNMKPKKRLRGIEVNYAKDFGRPTLISPRRLTKRSIEKRKIKLVSDTQDEAEPKELIPEVGEDKGTVRLTRAQERAEAEIELKKRRVREASSSRELSKPKQLFWQRRLQGLRSVDPDTNKPSKPIKLQADLKSLTPGGDHETLVHSIVSYLHNNVKVVGQNMSLNALKKNPGIWCNPEQPFCPPFFVSPEMIREQEKRVELARKNLAESIETLKCMEEDDYESE
ncbi:methyl-CpG-binding domain protein 2-like [Rhopilema esculentum]|uniref:methyl-CpG-binding domain protein 2-like n=1 Tax=Rhopilema esculentum TaxID=499914 RepID=UPI0031CEF612